MGMDMRMILVGAVLGLAAGCGGGGGSSQQTQTPTLAAPVFSPAAGSYSAAQSVTMSDVTSGAAIYYTTDGSTPTTTSKAYSGAVTVSATTTLKAIAVETGYNTSAAASATYTITLPTAATPVISPAGGSYTTAQSVTITDATSGAAIYYTTDGSTPTTASSVYSSAIAVAANTTIEAIAVETGYSNSAVATAAFTLTGPSVAIVLSTHDQANLMATQPAAQFSITSGGSDVVVVDETQQYQSIEGFGASFTDSSAYLLETVVPSASQSATLNELFTRSGDGIGLSFMRMPMGASDLALSVYSYDDTTNNATDDTLAGFSLTHDAAYVTPLVYAAKQLNPDLKLMANPWSPPAWMKTPASMLGGSLITTDANEQAFANYFVKFLAASHTAGIDYDYISIQNEPQYVTTSYPSMLMDAPTQATLVGSYVLPALQQANLSTKVLVWDHNWDGVSFPETVMGTLSSTQLQQVAGTAWHGYGGPVGAQETMHNLYPQLGQWMTEHSGGTWVSDQFTQDFLEINHVLRNWGKAYVKWSLALNEKLGPDLTQNAGLGGCNTCTPIVTVNSGTGAVTKTVEYYTLGHYSKYILPGAVRIFSSNTANISTSAFVNPDGSKVLVAFNSDSGNAHTLEAQWGNMQFSYTLPAYGAATFTWAGAQSAATATAATAQIQASSYSSESGMASETTSDSTGQYDMGYLTQGSYALYKNVDFGSGVSSVNLRAASAGSGGTAEFHLDSPTGTLIGTVTLPVTGGWQTWQTATGTVSGATGVHDLYMVIQSSSSSIANLNWFQFQ